MKQREELYAGWLGDEELVELQECRVGIGGAAQRFDQDRHQLGQDFAAALAAGRLGAASVPAAHDVRDPLRLTETEICECRQRIGIVLAAGENQITRGAQGWRLLEKMRVVALDGAQGAFERCREFPFVLETHEAGNRAKPLDAGGQLVGLLVVDHLQPVLEAAQELVSFAHLLGGLFADAAGGGQRPQGFAGSACAQAAVPPAPDQLLGLGEELDLADAAPAELHVVTGDGDFAAAAMSVDLPLDRMDIGDRCEIKVFAPDKRRHSLKKSGPSLSVAGDRPRLDHRRAFPVLAQTLVVSLGGEDRKRRRRRPGIGTQAQISAEDVAVSGAAFQDTHEITR